MLLHPHPLVFHEDHAALKEAGIAVACEAEGPNKVWVEHVIHQRQTVLDFADSVITGGWHRAAHLGLRGRDEGAEPLVGGCAEYQRRRGAALPNHAAPLARSHPRQYLRKAQPHDTGQDDIMSEYVRSRRGARITVAALETAARGSCDARRDLRRASPPSPTSAPAA